MKDARRFVSEPPTLSAVPSRDRPALEVDVIQAEPEVDVLESLTPVASKCIKRMETKVSLSKQAMEDEEMDKDSLENVLSQHEETRESCLSVPFTFFFFALYATSILLHERITTTHHIEDGISEGILSSTFDEAQSKNVFDCTTVPDVWNFLQETVVSPLHSPWFQRIDRIGINASTERSAEKIEDMAFNHFQLVGGVLLEQIRLVESPCDIKDLPEGWSCTSMGEMDSASYGPALLGDSNVSFAPANFPGEGFKPMFRKGEVSYGKGRLDWDQSYRRLHSDAANGELGANEFQGWKDGNPLQRNLRGAAHGRGDGEESEGTHAKKFWAPPDKRYPFFLMENLPISDLQERLSYLHNHAWLDHKSSHLDLKATLVSLEHNLLARVNVMFHFSRTSSLDVHFRVTTLPLRTYDFDNGKFNHKLLLIIDLVWLILLAWIFKKEVNELRIAIQRGGASKYVYNFWNCVDWVTIVCGFAVVAGFTNMTFRCSYMFEQMKSCPRPPEEMTEDKLKRLYFLHLEIDSLANFVMYYRLLQSSYVLIIMMRFFKAYRAQPRLALVTSTIFVAGVDIVHFMIVFCSIFLTYALAGVMLFGRRLTGFSSWPKAISTSFAIACGEFQWAELSAEHPVTTALWFWSFELIIYFILLNMVMAIVLDVYAEVRSQATHCPPLWVQLRDLAVDLKSKGSQYWQFQGNYIKAEHKLMDVVPNLSGPVTKKLIEEQIPEMSPDHIQSIFEETKLFEIAREKNVRLSDTMQVVSLMHAELKQLVEDVRNLQDKQANSSRVSSRLSRQIGDLTKLVEVKPPASFTNEGAPPATHTSDRLSSDINLSKTLDKLAHQIEESNSAHHADMEALRQELTELRMVRTLSNTARPREDTSEEPERTRGNQSPLQRDAEEAGESQGAREPGTAEDVQGVNCAKAQAMQCPNDSSKTAKIDFYFAEEILRTVASDSSYSRSVVRQEISEVKRQIANFASFVDSRNSAICGNMDKLSQGLNCLLASSGNWPGKETPKESQQSETSVVKDPEGTATPKVAKPVLDRSTVQAGDITGASASTSIPENNSAVGSSHQQVSHSGAVASGVSGSSHQQVSSGGPYQSSESHEQGRAIPDQRAKPAQSMRRPLSAVASHSREYEELHGWQPLQEPGLEWSAGSYDQRPVLPGQVAMIAHSAQPMYHVIRDERELHNYQYHVDPQGHHRAMQTWQARSRERNDRLAEHMELQDWYYDEPVLLC